MMMLVRMQTPARKDRFPSDLLFLIITLAPWVVMIWLLLPRR